MIDKATPTDHVDIEVIEEWSQERQWGNEVLLVQTPNWTLKRLEMRKGYAGGLQRHSVKDEAFTVAEGICEVEHDQGNGKLSRVMCTKGMTVHIPPGAAHRVRALSDCVLYEASTPVFGDREHLEERYGEQVPEGSLPNAEPSLHRPA